MYLVMLFLVILKLVNTTDLSISTISVFTNLVRAVGWVNGTNTFIAASSDNKLYYYSMDTNTLMNSVSG